MKPRSFDFNKPEEARLFLAGLRCNGNKVTYVRAGNVTYHFDRLTDEEAGKVATSIWLELMQQEKSPIKWVDDEVH